MSLYEVLKASKTERFPDYWTLLWGRKLSASMIKTLTGVLPLTFTAKGGTAVDWEIRGNDDVGENLFDIGTSASDYEHSHIITEIDSHSLSMNIVASGGTWAYRNKKISTTGEYTICLNSDKSYPRVLFALRNQEDTEWLTNSDISIPGYVYNAVYHGWFNEVSTTVGSATASVSIPNCLYWQLGFGYGSISDNIGTVGTLSNIMLVKGATAPDHYIPHQQGVGERTVNLLNAQTYEVGKAWNTSSNPDRATATIVAEPNTTYTLKVFESVADLVYIGVKESPTATTAVTSQQTTSGTVTITTTATAYTLAIQLNKTAITSSDCQSCKITLTAGSTAPSTYVPYGYEIPISCEHNISEDVTYDADKLLGFDGEPINQPPYQTTSDFIAVTQQKIVLSGTSVSSINKLIRVCQYDENKIYLGRLDSTLYGAIDYSFTFTLGSQAKFIKYSLYKTDTDIVAKEVNDYTFYIGSTPLTAGQSISKSSTGVDISTQVGENTVSTTLYNKPEMEIKYK